MAKTAPYPVADDGGPDGPGYDESSLRRLSGRARRNTKMNHDGGGAGTYPAANGGGELGAATQARRGGQHEPGAQAESRSRPLRRRAARMARPARVRMRSRKPWVLARRRLFGW